MAASKSEPSINLKLRSKRACTRSRTPLVHEYGNGQICTTDGVGYETPGNKSIFELVLNTSEGFIPLWDQDVLLRWEFDESALAFYSDPDGIKEYVRELFAEAIVQWGEAAPVRFSENSNAWDFQIRIEADNNCSPRGCSLARAFLPDSGRHQFIVFPKMFDQIRKEQVDTMLHELGHVFGLRHFFADVRERAWPVEIFGEHDAFSIMNYGPKSELTERDKTDLINLYQSAWSGKLTSINGTSIRLMKPFHYFSL